MKLSSNVTTTTDVSTDHGLLSLTRDVETGWWLVSDHQCGVWGHGRSLLEAMCDYWAALYSHIAALEDEKLVPHLEQQLSVMRERIRAVAE